MSFKVDALASMIRLGAGDFRGRIHIEEIDMAGKGSNGGSTGKGAGGSGSGSGNGGGRPGAGRGMGPGNAGGWPSTTGAVSGGSRSVNPPSTKS